MHRSFFTPALFKPARRLLRCEPLEDRRMLSLGSYPILPGMELLDANEGQITCGQFAGQVIYLDFDGAQNVTYNSPVTIRGIDIPAFEISPHENQIDAILAGLELSFAHTGITFTADHPTVCEYSTVYIGGDGSAFQPYGDFLGLAEQTDIGNLDRSDCAFVFSELVPDTDELLDVTSHEIGHLLGYSHLDEMTLAPNAQLASVAYTTDVHQTIAQEAADLYGALFGLPAISLQYEDYISQPTTSSWDTGNSISEGVVDEDATTLMMRYMNHFCAGGDGDELTDGLLFYDSAYTKANDSNYPEAVSHFNAGDIADAYYWLGRTMHLLQDSTVPAHIHNDQHGLFGTDEYEDNVSNYDNRFDFDTTTSGTSWNFQNWGGDWSAPQSLLARQDDYTSLEAIFRETTDYADDYDSDDYPGDWHNNVSDDYFPANRLLELDRTYHDNWAYYNVNGDGREIPAAEVEYLARDLGTWAVEQSAMLMRYFFFDLDQVTSAPTSINLQNSTHNSLQIDWDDTPAADGYAVYRSHNPDDGFTHLANTVLSAYNDTDLTPETDYYYRIFSYSNVAGLGGEYASISAQTDPTPPTIPGDANLDGTVDDADATVLADNWQTLSAATWAMGDFNADGRVDEIDATLLAVNWRKSVPTATSSAAQPIAVQPQTDSPTDTEEPTSNPEPPPIDTIAGDANLDWRVDEADVTILAANWQKLSAATWSQGDFNADGRVDDSDAAILARHWMMFV